MYYYKAGQDGPDRVNNVVSSKRPHEANSRDHRTQDIVEPEALFRKNRVYLSRSYHVDPLGPIDLLNKMSSVGEYFKVTPRCKSTMMTPTLKTDLSRALCFLDCQVRRR